MADQHRDAANPQIHHEATDANIRGVFGFAIGLVIVAVFIHFGVWILFRLLADQHVQRVAPEYPLAATQERRLPPEPRLQTNPRQDLRQLRYEEDAILNTYGWADRNGGVVRMPIGEAMKLIVKRGLPARKESHDAR